MAKLLLVGDNSIVDGNINDIIAIYEDTQILGKKEQELVKSGKFKLVEITDKTTNDIRNEVNAVHPVIKECWYDKMDDTWKDLKTRPRFTINYNAGVITHNYAKKTENIIAVNDEKIKAAKVN